MKQEQEIFERAMALPSCETREGYLREACGQNRELRRSVDELLAAFNDAGAIDFLKTGDRGPEGRTALIDARPEEGPGTVIGRYKLLQKIAEGGMGVVYMAEQEEPVRRRVALKIIKLGMDTKSVIARFEAERQALAMMDHPNIAKVLDGGATDAGRPYFVMELVRGVKITEYCDEAKLSTGQRLDLFIQVCQAIQHAHQKAIIHRDIKPSNILVTINDGVPVPKVIDFGIAKATEGRLTDKTLFTQFEALIGTPAYMSPEQAVMTSLDIDTRSDIYSLGVLLYELLAGSTPFDAKELLASGLDAMRQTIREQEPVRPSTRLATLKAEEQTTTAKRRSSDPPRLIHLLRGDLDWIVMKCLEKDRTRRYETANGLARDIERHLNNEPVMARPPSAGYRLQKSFRRNKLLFTAAAVVGFVLVLGALVSTWQAVRATTAVRAAELEKDHAQKAERVATSETQIAQEQRRRADAATLEARQNLYASDMLLAQHVQEDGNLDLTLNLLNRHRPAPGKPDLRGWEWRYLWGLCQSDEVGTFATNSGSLSHVVMSPDGRLLSIAEWGPARTAVKIWRFPSGRLLATPETNDAAGSVAFSPNGRLLAFGTRNHGLKLWDIEANKEKTILPGRYGEAFGSGLVFSPDGNILAASSGGEPQILLWNIEKKTLSMTFRVLSGRAYYDAPEGLTTNFIWLEPTPSGRMVWANKQSDIIVWDPAGRHQLGRLPWVAGEEKYITEGPIQEKHVTVSPDEKLLVAAAAGKCLTVWDLEKLQEIAKLPKSPAAVDVLRFSRDAHRVASGNGNGTVEVWDLGRKELVADWQAHQQAINGVAFMPDGKRLVTVSDDATAKLWEIENGREVRSFTRTLNAFRSLAISPDGQRIAAGTDGGVIKIWNSSTGQEIAALRAGQEAVWGLQFLGPDGNTIISLTSEEARLWRAPSLEEIAAAEAQRP